MLSKCPAPRLRPQPSVLLVIEVPTTRLLVSHTQGPLCTQPAPKRPGSHVSLRKGTCATPGVCKISPSALADPERPQAATWKTQSNVLVERGSRPSRAILVLRSPAWGGSRAPP